jgi:hypothetical protein
MLTRQHSSRSMLRDHIDEATGLLRPFPEMLQGQFLTFDSGKPEHYGIEVWKGTHPSSARYQRRIKRTACAAAAGEKRAAKSGFIWGIVTSTPCGRAFGGFRPTSPSIVHTYVELFATANQA